MYFLRELSIVSSLVEFKKDLKAGIRSKENRVFIFFEGTVLIKDEGIILDL